MNSIKQNEVTKTSVDPIGFTLSTQVMPVTTFLSPRITRLHMNLAGDIHKTMNPFLNNFGLDPPVETKFKSRIYSSTITAPRAITCMTVNYVCTKLFVGFEKAHFQVFDTITLEKDPDYEAPAEENHSFPVKKIVENGLESFFVICRNNVTQYYQNQSKYEFKYHLNFKVVAVLTQTDTPVIVDNTGKFYRLKSNYSESFERVQSDGVNRDIILDVRHALGPAIGKIDRAIGLDSVGDYFLILVQAQHNIAIVNLDIEKEEKVVWVQRIGLSCDPRCQIELRVGGNKYFYAAIHQRSSLSDQKIYYNELAQIEQSIDDQYFETLSGEVKRIDLYNEFLLVNTAQMHLEIFSLVNYSRVFDVEIGYPIRRSLVYKNSIVVTTNRGYLISRVIPTTNCCCCLHCEDLFAPGAHTKICRHFIPKKPFSYAFDE